MSREDRLANSHRFEDPAALARLDHLPTASPEEQEEYRHALKSFKSWLDAGPVAKSSKGYTNSVKKLMKVNRKTTAAMNDESYFEWVRNVRENISGNNSMSAGLKKFVTWCTERGRTGPPWEKTAGPGEKEYDVIPAEKENDRRKSGAQGRRPPEQTPEEDPAKNDTVKASAGSGESTAETPAAKKVKVEKETPEEKKAAPEKSTTDTEVAGLKLALQPDEDYGVVSASNGSAWVVLPADVDYIVLDKFTSCVEASGWSCSKRDSHCYTYKALASQVADLVLYADEGRLLVKSSKKEVAEKVGELYCGWLGSNA